MTAAHSLEEDNKLVIIFFGNEPNRAAVYTLDGKRVEKLFYSLFMPCN